MFSKSLGTAGVVFVHAILISAMVFMPFTHTLVSAQGTSTEPIAETAIATSTDSEEHTIEPDTVVDTGAAGATSESYTIENINDVEPNAATSTPQASSSEKTDDTATDTPDTTLDQMNVTSAASTTGSSTDNHASSSPADTASSSTVTITNDANASTTATTTAQSGGNTAAGTNTSVISTGDSFAYSNVVNLTNTNLIDSKGFIVFLNQLFGAQGADLRSFFDVFTDTATTTPCSELGCEARQLGTSLENKTDIENTITVSAQTGNNHASGATAAIVSGDAYAAANVTNIANTNIIDANYMMLTFSNFGDLLGDIVLPGKHLLEKLFQRIGSGSQLSTLRSESDAVIDNAISTNASTGGNSSTGSTSTISTGNATTYSNVYNQVNTNVVDSDSFTMLFRVSGDWDGEVYGLPDGLSWERTSAGISITNTPDMSATAASTPAVQADIVNTATVENTVSVSASTGNNHTTSTEQGYVETGNAYAAANVTNIANTNILGRNWSLLIFDIFGDWRGNISFGQPDLWIGGTASADNGTISSQQDVTYNFTISNLGDAHASNVRLTGTINSDLVALSQPLEDIDIGTLAPGETIEKTFSAKAAKSLPYGSFPIDLTVEVSGDEPEPNLENNTEIVTVLAENRRRSGSGGSGIKPSDITLHGDLVITKSASHDTIRPGDTVSYEVSITNNGGPVYGATLYDTLFNPMGDAIANKQWNLETIESDETVTINYDTQYATATPNGTYLNRAQVLGYHRNRIPKHMYPYDSMVATLPLTVSTSTPRVLGVATSTESCGPYITSYLKRDKANDPTQVQRLQTFFNEYTRYHVPVSGTFDSSTEAVVRKFQTQHAADILEPWGIQQPSGYVYYTTKKKINELYCDDPSAFPLTPAELAEINHYKLVQGPRTHNTPTPTPPEPTPPMTTKDSDTTRTHTDTATDKIQSTIAAPEVMPDTTSVAENLFTRMSGWIKNTRLANLSLWSMLFANE